ncbi:MAG: hypothetical protein GXY92_02960 [Syntrophomonadaceae bacterium]|nr:hypothetical protein [Syntrophomonadaceae bacterium]
MDAQQITGLCISLIGAGFLFFRRFCARGVAGYARNNLPYRIENDSTLKFVEYVYAIFGGICLIVGGYVFFA